MNIFFSSDHHFGHAKIIEYCKRPFSSVEEMNEALIENHNRVVKPKDRAYFLGDLAFNYSEEELAKLMKRLNGDKVIVTGNHDRFKRLGDYIVCHRIAELRGPTWAPYNPTLCHYPMLSWNASFHGTFQLHGHSHGGIPFDPTVRRLDVGVDCFNYAPISWDEIVEKLKAVPSPRERGEKLLDT